MTNEDAEMIVDAIRKLDVWPGHDIATVRDLVDACEEAGFIVCWGFLSDALLAETIPDGVWAIAADPGR